MLRRYYSWNWIASVSESTQTSSASMMRNGIVNDDGEDDENAKNYEDNVSEEDDDVKQA